MTKSTNKNNNRLKTCTQCGTERRLRFFHRTIDNPNAYRGKKREYLGLDAWSDVCMICTKEKEPQNIETHYRFVPLGYRPLPPMGMKRGYFDI